jgi:hypothetical protein
MVSRKVSIPSDTLNKIDATGGTISIVGGYKIHSFASANRTGISSSFEVKYPGIIEFFMVGGGGSGAGSFSGGGGAGGAIYGIGIYLSVGVYPVTVGSGAIGGLGWSNGTSMNGVTGSDTTFNSLAANGGGGGGMFGYTTGNPFGQPGLPGGSGGGGGSTDGSASRNPANCVGGSSTQNQPANATKYGNSGGSGFVTTVSTYGGGGGGGAGGTGGTGTASKPGDGGIGIQNSISGTLIYYAGGGGGGSQGTGFGAGGSGGGGSGTATTTRAGDGINGLGGGGGAGGYNGVSNSQIGGDGGSGIVIIRYPYS